MMVNTNIDEQFLNVFKNCLKIEAKTVSIKTLLGERNLKRIDYSPYYQRNYVWDNAKQSFFIESVILGTEIPPLIFFKSGMSIEVIDGRQRFETLKRFKENDIRLSNKGLMTLEFLGKKTFNSIDSDIQDVFWNSNIRIFEFEVVNVPNLDPKVEDKIKKEIFRRYNTGITPLTSSEVDNARYNDDTLSDKFKSELVQNTEFKNKVLDCFFTSDSKKFDNEEIVNYLRRIFILNKFPISKYATGKERTETLDLLYDFAKQNIIDVNEEFKVIESQVGKVHNLFSNFTSSDPKLKNKLIYECIFWALRIMESEEHHINLDEHKEEIKTHFLNNLNIYSADESHYYGKILSRFTDTAEIFKKIYSFDFSIFIRNQNFKQDVTEIFLKEKDSAAKIVQFENLRLNKPSPISTPIDEIKTDIKSSRYLVRPSYQRQEKISNFKASAIIESILLGISLPPIFIFKRIDNNIKEVIDGQQRLLSIIGFLGEKYTDELGKLVFPNNNSFKLTGLKILTDLNRKNYSQLSDDYKDKILDFTIDVIMIEEKINKDFEPTDLFIRLNQKPYPIQQNSFEMWNATVDAEIIKEIKRVTLENSSWFFIKETKNKIEDRDDRMENEELITILSYIKYNSLTESFEKIIGFFTRIDNITCRLTYKAGLTEFLQKLEKEAIEKSSFIQSILHTEKLIKLLNKLLDNKEDKEILNNFLNVDSAKGYRRSKQDFYILWIVLVSYTNIDEVNDKDILITVKDMVSKFRNIKTSLAEQYVDELKALYK